MNEFFIIKPYFFLLKIIIILKKTNFKYKIKKTKIPKKKKKKTLEINSYNTTIPFHTYTHTNHIPKSYS